MKLNLLENALDFITKGIDELFDDEHHFTPVKPTERSVRNYKYGVIHLFGGFLLLLKERLARHIPELIYEGSIRKVKEQVKNGNRNPKTVDLDVALERLEIGPKVTFPAEELKCIRRMQDLRNAFEHYEVSINPYQVWSETTRFLKIIDQFLVNQLEIHLEERPETEGLHSKIRQIEQVWQRIQEKRVREWHTTMKGLLQSFKENSDTVVQDLEIGHIASKGTEPIFMFCPECFNESLICYGDYEGICTNCKTYFHITTCERCGVQIIQDELEVSDEIIWCDNCQATIMGSN